MTSQPQEYSEKSGHIRVRGARVHNLKNVDVDIPHDSFVVVTGVSGSGKSSLAFDTIFAEAQRRYVESLSTYTRQFLNQLERADVDSIDGLPPTISVDQRSGAVQHRSTLATMSEIYDFLRLLYARAGTVHCTECGHVVSQQSPQAIVDLVSRYEERSKLMILAPLVVGRRGKHRDVFERICKDGFVRARVDGEIVDAASPPDLAQSKNHTIEAVIDRIILKEGIRPRLNESITLALKHGNGTCLVARQDGDAWCEQLFSSTLACPSCEISFPDLEPRTFSFNSHYGACPNCSGVGFLEDETTSTQHPCPDCEGARLSELARAVTVLEKPIHEFTDMSVGTALNWTTHQLDSIALEAEDPPQSQLAIKSILPEIQSRLNYLNEVGLEYLTLSRPADTLSGGEFQRARLASCLGSGLTGACYVLDEPTIGLHARDTDRMIQILERLRDQGNSVLVVEHDVDIMRHADYLIDLGPGAGNHGGALLAAGPVNEVKNNDRSVTARFLKNDQSLREKATRAIDSALTISITGANQNNLKNVDVQIPLGVFVVVTGVSGSGKTTLIKQTLLTDLRRRLENSQSAKESQQIQRIVEIDRSPIGRTGRSNPATYSGVWDEIRKIFSKTRESRIRGFKATRFSFNAKTGRCKECSGHGTRRIEMNFLPDIFVECPVCRGARFNRQTLSIRYRGQNVADVLQMPISQAVEFFDSFPRVGRILKMFDDVGLGYLQLGQSSQALSGGEAQRVKLATELCRKNNEHTLFVLDEPTTGLHPADVERLIDVLDQLVDSDNSVIVIEHQLDVIANADWIIDLGPEGGDKGGAVVATGTPSDLVTNSVTHTGRALQLVLANN